MSEFADALLLPGAPRQPSRLRDLSRYLALVADELDALHQRDAARLREAGEARRRCETDLRTVVDDGDDSPAVPLPVEIAGFLEDALAELDGFAREDEEERTRWLVIEDDALRSIYGSKLHPARGGIYLDLPACDARLDVRF